MKKDDVVFTTSLGKIVYEFINALASGHQPHTSLWDLHRGNREALTCTNYVSRIRRLPSGLLVFDFGSDSMAPWKIAVTTAADALYVCRLEQGLNHLDLARRLLQRGITFRTLFFLRTIPTVWRLSGL